MITVLFIRTDRLSCINIRVIIIIIIIIIITIIIIIVHGLIPPRKHVNASSVKLVQLSQRS